MIVEVFFAIPMDLDRQSGASHISFPIWRPIPIVHNIGEYTVRKKPKMASNIRNRTRYRALDHCKVRS